jgi:hypothetical protein
MPDTFGSPYHGNSAQHRAWMRGFEDQRTGKAFNSGPAAQHASITLAYNQGWKAGDVPRADVRRNHTKASNHVGFVNGCPDCAKP